MQVHQQKQVPWIDAAGAVQKPDSNHIAFLYYNGGRTVGFLENNGATAIYMLSTGNFTVLSGSSVLVLDSKVLFDSSDLEPTHLVRTWTPLEPNQFPWQQWQDPVVPSATDAIPAATLPRPLWKGSALGSVIKSALPLEAVNFTVGVGFCLMTCFSNYGVCRVAGV